MRKIIITYILITAILFSAGQALAFQPDTLSLVPIEEGDDTRLTLIKTIAPSLSVTGTSAKYALSVTCVSSVNRISATLQIQQLSGNQWVNYSTPWYASSTSSLLATSGTKTVDKGKTYRLKVTITASNGTTSETVTANS